MQHWVAIVGERSGAVVEREQVRVDIWIGVLGVRMVVVIGVGGLADHVNSPTFATGVGLVLYGYRNSVGDLGRATGPELGKARRRGRYRRGSAGSRS